MSGMRYGQVPLRSSNQILNALKRLGVQEGRARSTSHRFLYRELPDGRKVSNPLPMGKREVRRGTLRNILEALEIPLEDFLDALR